MEIGDSVYYLPYHGTHVFRKTDSNFIDSETKKNKSVLNRVVRKTT